MDKPSDKTYKALYNALKGGKVPEGWRELQVTDNRGVDAQSGLVAKTWVNDGTGQTVLTFLGPVSATTLPIANKGAGQSDLSIFAGR
jgi:hypothetical protein